MDRGRLIRVIIAEQCSRAEQTIMRRLLIDQARFFPHVRRSRAECLFYTHAVYELTVETVFSAAHSLVIQGTPEQIHGHDWHVTVAVTGASLDRDGLLVDFHAVERALVEIVAPFRNANLNQTAPFTSVNPSAENVAAFIARSLESRLKSLVAAGSSQEPTNSHDRPWVAWVRVTEAHGCAVKWINDNRRGAVK